MNKLLTIVVPTYNMEKFLEKCLSSLIINNKEFLELIEVIVVIDGATDKSSEIAYNYYHKYPTIFKVIEKENGNYGSCINAGLAASTGRYFRILDADDSFNKEGLHQLIDILYNLSSDIDLICTNYDVYDDSDKLIESNRFETSMTGNVLKYSDIDFWASNQTSMVAMHAFTYRTRLLKENNYYQQEGISYTDTEFVFIPQQYVKNILILNINLYRYLVGRVGQTVSQAPSRNRTEQYYKVATKLIHIYIDGIKNRPKSLKHNQMCCLKNVIKSYFFYSLLFLPKEEETEIRLRNIAKILSDNDQEFWTYLLSSKIHYLPYIKLWYTRGIYLSENNIVKFMLSVKRIFNRILWF